MGLVACEACGKQISEAAASCPGCGHPRGQVIEVAEPPRPMRSPGSLDLTDPVHAIGVGLVLLFLAFVCWLIWAQLS